MVAQAPLPLLRRARKPDAPASARWRYERYLHENVLPFLLSRRRWQPPFVLHEPTATELAAQLPQFASELAAAAAMQWLAMSAADSPVEEGELEEVCAEELAAEVGQAFGEGAGEDLAFASLDLPAVQRAFERRLAPIEPSALPAAVRAQLEEVLELKLRAQFLVMAIANAAVVPAVRQACDLEIVRLLARQARADVLAAWKHLRSATPSVAEPAPSAVVDPEPDDDFVPEPDSEDE